MRLFGRVELTTVELPNALEFSISRESGLVEWTGGMVIGLLGLWMFWKVNTPFSRLIVVVVCVAAAASAIASWVQGGSTKLRVTADELFAEGNLNKLFSTEVRIPASEIASEMTANPAACTSSTDGAAPAFCPGWMPIREAP